MTVAVISAGEQRTPSVMMVHGCRVARVTLLAWAVSAAVCVSAAGAEPGGTTPGAAEAARREESGAAVDFEATVAGVLVRRCVECHAGSDAEGELDLTTAAGLAAGGTATT